MWCTHYLKMGSKCVYTTSDSTVSEIRAPLYYKYFGISTGEIHKWFLCFASKHRIKSIHFFYWHHFHKIFTKYKMNLIKLNKERKQKLFRKIYRQYKNLYCAKKKVECTRNVNVILKEMFWALTTHFFFLFAFICLK